GLRWIHLWITGHEHDIYAGVVAKLFVALQVARITGEVLCWGELGRIYEDAHDHDAALADACSRLSNQTDVACVQVTHRRHETDRGSASLPFHRQPLHRRHRGHHEHESNYGWVRLTVEP